jgi:hypothetical protein
MMWLAIVVENPFSASNGRLSDRNSVRRVTSLTGHVTSISVEKVSTLKIQKPHTARNIQEQDQRSRCPDFRKEFHIPSVREWWRTGVGHFLDPEGNLVGVAGPE